MIIPISEESHYIEVKRYVSDLLKIANSDLFTNVKGYYQKLIDNLYQVGYYKDNESVIPFLVQEKK